MAAETKASVAARFANRAYVSAADFGALIDSYTDASDVLFAIATAAQNGNKGVVVVSGSSTVTFSSAAAQGLRMLNTATTAAAQQLMGGGTVGRVVFEAITTASSQTALGGGAVGRSLFETTTTAAAQAIIGSVSAATQTEMETATANGVVVTPANMQWHPGMPKAWVNFNGLVATSVRSSYNVSSVVRNGGGDYTVVFTTPFAAANYAYMGTADLSAGVLGSPRQIEYVTMTAGGFRFQIADLNPNAVDCEVINMFFFGDR